MPVSSQGLPISQCLTKKGFWTPLTTLITSQVFCGRSRIFILSIRNLIFNLNTTQAARFIVSIYTRCRLFVCVSTWFTCFILTRITKDFTVCCLWLSERMKSLIVISFFLLLFHFFLLYCPSQFSFANHI